MRKFNIKSFTAGLLCGGMVMALCAPTFAAQTVKNLEAYYKNIKLNIDGQLVVPKDVAGNVVDPFIVDGTTYLPIRAVAGALGFGVDWDTATDTVLVTTGGGVTDKNGQTVFLDSLAQVTSSPSSEAFRRWNIEKDYDGTGLQYNHSLVALVGGSVPGGTITQYAQYELGRSYTALTGRIVPMRGLAAVSGSTHQIKIYGDNELLYSSPVFNSSLSSSYEAYNLDVSNVGVLKVEMVSVRMTVPGVDTGLALIQPTLVCK